MNNNMNRINTKFNAKFLFYGRSKNCKKEKSNCEAERNESSKSRI